MWFNKIKEFTNEVMSNAVENELDEIEILKKEL